MNKVIQGSVDLYSLLHRDELEKTFKFCSTAWETTQPELRDSLLKKINSHLSNIDVNGSQSTEERVHDSPTKDEIFMSGEEQRLLAYLKSRRLLRTEDTMNIKNFSQDIVRGRRPRLHRGQLGLECVNK